jgi:hypothetical protein
MSDVEVPPAPEPVIDEEPDEGNAAGGVDAVEEPVNTDPVTPDPPTSDDEDELPDEVTEPEEPDTEANTEDPSVEPSA